MEMVAESSKPRKTLLRRLTKHGPVTEPARIIQTESLWSSPEESRCCNWTPVFWRRSRPWALRSLLKQMEQLLLQLALTGSASVRKPEQNLCKHPVRNLNSSIRRLKPCPMPLSTCDSNIFFCSRWTGRNAIEIPNLLSGIVWKTHVGASASKHTNLWESHDDTRQTCSSRSRCTRGRPLKPSRFQIDNPDWPHVPFRVRPSSSTFAGRPQMQEFAWPQLPA